jgi:hypothetical protein
MLGSLSHAHITDPFCSDSAKSQQLDFSIILQQPSPP